MTINLEDPKDKLQGLLKSEALDDAIEQGYVKRVQHPSFPLDLLNYTPECQFKSAWNQVTMACRGLIIHRKTRDIVARPFRKFFNWETHQNPDVEWCPPLPNGQWQGLEKMDGSLGILYWWSNEGGPGPEPYIATRGSFKSDQAIRATSMIRLNYGGALMKLHSLSFGYTHLFEIIYPENRIVTNYGDEEKLVYLGSIVKETGEYLNLKTLEGEFPQPSRWTESEFYQHHGLPEVDPYEWLVRHAEEEGIEGYVLTFETGLMAKLKTEEYRRLHKIATGFSKKRVWEWLAENGLGSIREIEEIIPPQHKDLADKYTKELSETYNNIKSDAQRTFAQRPQGNETSENARRKQAAQHFMGTAKYPSLCFNLLDENHQAFEKGLWKAVWLECQDQNQEGKRAS